MYKYGLNCVFDCGYCKNGELCFIDMGVCIDGCEDGWIGGFCVIGYVYIFIWLYCLINKMDNKW